MGQNTSSSDTATVLCRSQKIFRLSKRSPLLQFERLFEPLTGVPESGVYGALHLGGEPPNDIMLVKGDLFPECRQCGKQVRYRLIRSAPYIFEDKDFD
jgi:hypothetical protein